jgi:hypothetical protein
MTVSGMASLSCASCHEPVPPFSSLLTNLCRVTNIRLAALFASAGQVYKLGTKGLIAW